MTAPWLTRARALASAARTTGALEPIRSEQTTIEGFCVRLLSGFERKPSRRTAHGAGAAPDPFEPPYPSALHVGDRPPDHALLLNRYPVLDDHILVVTLAALPQEAPAAPADLRVLDDLLDDHDGLGFYNGGRAAGASQPHRHLQWISREATGSIPLEAAIVAAIPAGRVTGWPFVHAIAPRSTPTDDLFAAVGRDPAAPGPHSLLTMRRWRLLVPRSTGRVRSMPINSLGYAGLLAVTSAGQLEALREMGPWAVLREAGCGAA